MLYPNSPEKHDREALITPRASADYFDDEPDEMPASLVPCFHDGFLEHVAESYAIVGFETWDTGYVLTVPMVGSEP